SLCLFYVCADQRGLHSFPTRRSSDLVCDDEKVAAGLELGCEAAVPVGQHALERRLQGFARRQLLRIDVLVAALEAGMALVVERQIGRAHVIAAATDLHLFSAVHLDSLRFVDTLQRALVTL